MRREGNQEKNRGEKITKTKCRGTAFLRRQEKSKSKKGGEKRKEKRG